MATLLLRSLAAVLSIDPAFHPRGVVAMRVDPLGVCSCGAPPFRSAYSKAHRPSQAWSRRRSPSICRWTETWEGCVAAGQPYSRHRRCIRATCASPGYFQTAGISIIEGRDFDSRDRRSTPWVMAINQTLARRSALGREPLGAAFNVNGNLRQVIAVVANVKHQTLNGDSGREFYIPSRRRPRSSRRKPSSSAPRIRWPVPAIREAIWRVDRDQAIGTGRTASAGRSHAHPASRSELAARKLAGTALLLAALGVYGVIAYRLAQRTREVAIRVALGAPPWRVTWTVVGETLAFVAIGHVTGVPLALGAGEAVREFLYGVAPRDASLVAACAVTIGAAIAAAYCRRNGRSPLIPRRRYGGIGMESFARDHQYAAERAPQSRFRGPADLVDDRGIRRAGTHAGGGIYARSGSSHRSPGNRAKSPSVEHSVRPCSIASAARCASGTRFGRLLVCDNSPRNVSR